MIATNGFLTAFERYKFVLGRAPPWTPLEKLTALPDPLVGLRERILLLRGRGGEAEEEGKAKGEEG